MIVAVSFSGLRQKCAFKFPVAAGKVREVGFEEAAMDLPEARFWIVCGLPTTGPNIFRTSAAALTY
jgi:hypothetical protein